MKINWLIKFIVLLSGLLMSAGSQAAISDGEQVALKALYTSTGGSSWTTKTGWVDSNTCTPDSLNGVICIACDAHGITCDTADNVSVIELINNNLVGAIPSSIGQLTNLIRLRLQDNKLNGSIPSELGSLTKLVTLRLYNNELEGAIPHELTDLVNLLYLELYDNKLSGQLPVGLGNLSKLWNFYIKGNQFDGELPADLTSMGSLSTIDNLFLDLRWNGLRSDDATLNSFIDSYHINPENLIPYKDSQTLAPTGVSDKKTPTSVTLSWDSFQTNPPTLGGYKLLMATSEAGPFDKLILDINDRFTTSATINNLDPVTNYWFKVCSYTGTHDENLKNIVISEHSPVVSKGVPIVDAGDDQVVNELDTVTLLATASDTDGGSIASYSWSLTGSGDIVGANATSYSFTAPEVASAGAVFVYRVTVTDNEGYIAYDDVEITVNDTNPTVSAGEDQTVNEGVPVELEASASPGNVNGTIVEYLWEQVSGSPVMINNKDTSIASFSLSIVDAAILSETLEFKVTVTDSDSKTATDNVQILVNNVLTSPSVDLGADQTVNEGATVTLSASVSDNGTITNFGWSQVSGSWVELSASPTDPFGVSFIAPMLPADSSEVFLFEVTVTDNDDQPATDQVQVTVNDVNDRPEVNPTTDLPGDEVEEE